MNIQQTRNLGSAFTALADAGVAVGHFTTTTLFVWPVGEDELREAVRAVKTVVGTLAKGSGDYGITLTGELHGLEVVVEPLGGVCERVQVGVKVEKRPDPDAPMVDVEVPVYETVCPDSVLAEVAA